MLGISVYLSTYFSVHQSRRSQFDRGTMFSKVKHLKASLISGMKSLATVCAFRAKQASLVLMFAN